MKKQFKKLKKLIISGDDFENAISYFFSEIHSTPGFMQQGEILNKSPVLLAVIPKTLESLYKQVLKSSEAKYRDTSMYMTYISFTYIKEFGFYHGGFQITGGFGMYIYFEDVGVGVLTANFAGNSNSWFSRFTTLQGKNAITPFTRSGNSRDIN